MGSFIKSLKKGLLLSLVLLVLCGIVYPLTVTGISQIVFPKESNGNLVEVNGKAVGSELVGQSFSDARFFKGRPSAVNYNTYTKEDLVPDKDGNVEYKGVSTGSQNLAPSNKELTNRIKKDLDKFLKENPDIKVSDIPADLLTASGSGLDPHISPESAKIQIPAISKATGISKERLQTIVDNNTSKKQFGIFGEDKVNVLKTNIDVAKEIGLI